MSKKRSHVNKKIFSKKFLNDIIKTEAAIEHRQIIIMKSDFDYIKNKVKKIIINKNVDLITLSYGSVITSLISDTAKYYTNKHITDFSDNYINTFIAITILLILLFINKCIKPISSRSFDLLNKTHLDDINDRLNEIEERLQQTYNKIDNNDDHTAN